CGKCGAAYNGAWRDKNERLLSPLKRNGPKGSGQFEAVSWEVALRDIAAKLTSIADEHSAASIFHTHYTGTCSAIAGDFPSRFFERLGATEINPDTVCNNAGHVAWGYVFGDSCNGFDPRTAKDSNCIVVWGANPSNSAPHVHKHWLKAQDATVIVIDPVRHETAEEADLYLQLRPGSDAALAFAMLHVMQRDSLLDMSYIADHVLGYDDVKGTISSCTPAWGEEQTGVPADLIEQAAHIYCKGPSILWMGQGVQRQPSGGNIARALAMLPAFTGNIGKPGTGAYYLNRTVAMGGAGGASPAYKPSAEDASSVSQMDIPVMLQNNDRIQAYMVWNCNPVASNPDQALMRSGLARDDLFTVVVDCFATDTADYADYVLPAASFLEFDDVNVSYFELIIAPQVKCQEPMGNSLPNQEIFRRLSTAMGYTDDDLFEADQDIIDKTIKASGAPVDWAGLKQAGYSYVSDEPLILWGDGKFATPSGRIEISSAAAEADGLPRVPHHQADAAPADGFFRLLSPSDKHLMNSSYGNDARVRGLMGPATVMINPDDASQHGLADGQPVRLSNHAGQIDLMAHVSDAVPAGTLLSSKSRWAKCEDSAVNINVVHMARKTDMGESTSVHGTEVRLECLPVS
ncbi:MAG: molybdopterin-dependent oxidoreductase, partial [Rhodospirillales bacterium]|nr:molybdopterin-dependent oxidoreductase [Rhodospirillales bacterium]